MGHTIEMLSFDAAMDRKQIQKKCDIWGDHHADLEERGWCMGQGLGSPVRFTDLVFDSEEEASEYLIKTTGNYRQTAVKYKVHPEVKKTKAMEDLERRVGEYRIRIADLNKPHYMGVKQATVKCNSCGSSLATAYCGKTYNNSCPVCRAELRPQSILQKREQYGSTLRELEKRLAAEEKKNVRKEQCKLFWMVCCEVHA